MADAIPPDVKRFKVSVAAHVVYSAFAGLIGIALGFLCLPLFDIHLAPHVFWRLIWFAVMFFVPLCVFVPVLINWFSVPSGFSAEGIYAASPLGAPRFIRWGDIARARKLTILNLRFLRLNSRVDGKETVLPLYQARPKEFIDEIRKFAPPDSPVLKALG